MNYLMDEQKLHEYSDVHIYYVNVFLLYFMQVNIIMQICFRCIF